MISPSFLELDQSSFTDGEANVVKIRDQRIAVFLVDGRYFAINNRCPHAGAALGRGEVTGTSVSCPLHHWQFDLESGQCPQSPGTSAVTFPVRVNGETIEVDVSSILSEPIRRQFLVRYGAMGWVARFEWSIAADAEDQTFEHRERVVIQTSRGQEFGEVLSGPEPIATGAGTEAAGSIVRPVTAEDKIAHAQIDDATFDLEACHRIVADHTSKLDVIDFEPLFDGETIVVYYLGEDPEVLQPLAQQLNTEFTERVVLQSAIDDHAPVTGETGGGCGSGGCGSGGCGSGGCSS
ncbi:MAG: Rieske 2Fe-2S domain-containing protein [Planctomycetota bacterium]|nr:Rieske 2Fe-2S domain-containing protein [Planctomycetota bacterium]